MTARPPWRVLYFCTVPVLSAGLAVGVAAATAGVTGSGTGQASTGSVTLRVNASASHTCGFILLPGSRTGGAGCTFSVSYTGSLGAYLSLTVQVAAAAGVGGRPLYDGTNVSGLTLAISDGHASYLVPTGPARSGCGARLSCWTSANELAAWYQGSTPELIFAAGDSVTFTVTADFPATASAAYQGGTASVRLTVQAVQAPANPLPARCTTSTIGQPCPAAGTFTWS